MRAPAAYDEFAWLYDREWAAQFHREARPALERALFKRLRPGAWVLDLCCGAGHLAAELLARGCRVVGLDCSEQMLRYARKRAPGADLVLADARAFGFAAQFDAVVSTFDSLNHILEPAELKAVFENVYQVLRPGGWFVFDLNMEACFRSVWRGTSASVRSDRVWVLQGSYDSKRRLARARLTLFRWENAWRRYDIEILERCYPAEQVLLALSQAGFRELECCRAEQLGMSADSGAGRSFFMAVR